LWISKGSNGRFLDGKQPGACYAIFGARISHVCAPLPDAPRPVTLLFVSVDKRDVVNPLGNLARAEAPPRAPHRRYDAQQHGHRATHHRSLVPPHQYSFAARRAYDAVRYGLLVADALRSLTDRLDVVTRDGADAHTINISRDSRSHTK